jgi:hypothetical protein
MGCWSAAPGGCRDDDTPEGLKHMSVRRKNLTLVSAAGAALALTAAAAAPALAAGEETADVTYSCNSGAASPTASYAVDAPPAKMAAGQTVKLGTTATFSLNATDSGLAQAVLTDQGPPVRPATAVGGKITTPTSNKAVGLNLNIAKTDFGNAGAGATTADLSGKTLLRSTAVGTFTLKLGDLGLVHLVGFDSTGAETQAFDFPSSDGTFTGCVNTAGKTTLANGATAATVKVVKDRTKTTVGASFSKAKHSITGTAKVKSHFGIKAKGKVKFQLMKGTKTIKTVTKKLKRQAAKATFSGVTKAGKYTVKAKYLGSSNLKASSGSKSVIVS